MKQQIYNYVERFNIALDVDRRIWIVSQSKHTRTIVYPNTQVDLCNLSMEIETGVTNYVKYN